MNVIESYKRAVENSDENLLKDQVHLTKDGKIDQLIIYMRPISVAQTFAEAISQRLQPTR